MAEESANIKDIEQGDLEKTFAKFIVNQGKVDRDKNFLTELFKNINNLGVEKPDMTPEITPVNPIVNAGVPPKELAPRPFGVELPNAPFATQSDADEDLLRQNIEQIRKQASARQLGDTQNITTNTLGTGIVRQNIEEVPGRASIFGATESLLNAKQKAETMKLPVQKGSLTPETASQLADTIDKDIFSGYGIIGRMLGYDRGKIVTELAKRGTILPTEKVYNTYMDTLNSSSSGINALGVISKQLSGLADEKDWVSAWGQGIIDWLTGKAKSNTNSAAYLANIKASVPLLARSLGHTGVLTELDVASVAQGLPELTDSADLAKAKIANVIALISGKLKASENNFYSQLTYHGGPMPVEQRRQLGNYNTLDLIVGKTGTTAPNTQKEETLKEEKKPQGKTIIKTQTNPKTGQKRIVYSDGSTEIIK